MSDAPATDVPVMPVGWRANRSLAELLSVHTLLLSLGAVFYGISTLPALATYSDLLKLVAAALGFTAAKAMVSFKTPTEQAKLAAVDRAGMKAVINQAAVLALFVCLTGCAGANVWLACELGKLPQSAQIVIPAAVAALEQGSQEAALTSLEGIATGLAPGQLECIVQAISADAQKTGRAVIVTNAAAFKVKHPKTCIQK